MNLIRQASLAILIAIFTTVTGLAQDSIPWIQDLSEARRLAEQQQRLVLLHFWGDGCPPCQQLEATVFNQPELIRVVSMNFIPVKIHVQQQPNIASHYKIRQIPTDVIVLPTGVELFRTTSPPKANSYVAMLDQVRANALAQGFQEVNRLAQSAERFARNSVDQVTSSLAALPPRLSDEEPPAQSINGDVSGGSLQPSNTQATNIQATSVQQNWRNLAVGAASSTATRGSVVNNEFVGPLDRQTAVQAASANPRYGNPYVNDPMANSPTGNPPTLANAGNPGPIAQTPPPAQPDLRAEPANPQRSWQPAANSPAAANNLPSNPGLPSGPPAHSAPTLSQQLPANAPPLALDGYCPVTLLLQQKWELGSAQFGAIHRGRTYLFRSQAERDRFLAPGSADQFAPVLSGFDPVRFTELRQSVAGSREHGVVYQNQIYLFADEQALARFEQQPERYVTVVRQAMTTARQAPPQR